MFGDRTRSEVASVSFAETKRTSRLLSHADRVADRRIVLAVLVLPHLLDPSADVFRFSGLESARVRSGHFAKTIGAIHTRGSSRTSPRPSVWIARPAVVVSISVDHYHYPCDIWKANGYGMQVEANRGGQEAPAVP